MWDVDRSLLNHCRKPLLKSCKRTICANKRFSFFFFSTLPPVLRLDLCPSPWDINSVELFLHQTLRKWQQLHISSLQSLISLPSSRACDRLCDSYQIIISIQPTPETRKKQLQMWIDLIASYCKAHSIFEIDINNSSFPLWHNEKIKST